MMKKWLAAALAVSMFCAPAYALERAAKMPDHAWLERYSDYSADGGMWSVRSNQTAAALRRMSAEGMSYAGLACFGMELTGDMDTGITAPVLAFYYVGGTKLDASSASVAVGGRRYDMTLYTEPVQMGRLEGERMTALLDETGMEMVRAMIVAQEANIRLYGGGTTFTIESRKKDSYTGARDELAARSLDGLKDMLGEFDALGYSLFDLGADWWERTRGGRSEISVCLLPAEDRIDDLGVRLEEPMFALYRGDQGNAVRDLQNLLVEKGYMQGQASSNYNESTANAVKAAQKWLGMLPTGAADEKLIRQLTKNAVPMEERSEVAEPEWKRAEDVCELAINRFWTAPAVESSGGDRRTTVDRDNELVIFEGWIRSLAKEDLDLYWKLSATAFYDGHEFPCVLVCEKNDGQTLASSLTQMGQGRLLVYAEAPREIAAKEGWTLEIRAGEETFRFE